MERVVLCVDENNKNDDAGGVLLILMTTCTTILPLCYASIVESIIVGSLSLMIVAGVVVKLDSIVRMWIIIILL